MSKLASLKLEPIDIVELSNGQADNVKENLPPKQTPFSPTPVQQQTTSPTLQPSPRVSNKGKSFIQGALFNLPTTPKSKQKVSHSHGKRKFGKKGSRSSVTSTDSVTGVEQNSSNGSADRKVQSTSSSTGSGSPRLPSPTTQEKAKYYKLTFDHDQELFLYKQIMKTILHPLGKPDQRPGYGTSELEAKLQQVFGVPAESHKKILEETQNNKPSNVVLTATVKEAKDLLTGQNAGSQEVFCVLGVVATTSASPKSTPGLKKRSTKEQPTDIKQTGHSKTTPGKPFKWHETFDIDVKDFQTQDLQVYACQRTEKNDHEIKKSGLKRFFKNLRSYSEKEKQNCGYIGECVLPLKQIPATTGLEDWFTLLDSKKEKPGNRGKVKLKLELGVKQPNGIDTVDSEQCTVEEFHYVVKAMYRYAIKTCAENPKKNSSEPTQFNQLPGQLKSILYQYAAQNHFSKLSQCLVEAVVVMELSSDKYCPCVISENLLKESLVSLEMDWQSSQFGGMVEPGQGTKKRLSNVEMALFDSAATSYVLHLVDTMKSDTCVPRLFPVTHIKLDQLNKRVSLAVTVMNMTVWENNERARKKATNLVMEQIQEDIKIWVQEQLSYLDQSESGHEPVIPDMRALAGIIGDASRLLAPVHAISQYFQRLGVDYFKIASLEMERRLSTKCMELMQELDRYQLRFHKYPTNIRDSSTVSLQLYAALRGFFSVVRGNIGDRELFKMSISSYQTWFEHAVMFWLQTFREECIKRMEKALEIEKDVVQVTSLVKHSNSSVDVLSCFSKIISEWMEIDFTDADIAVLGCTKITDTICDGATQYAERIHCILENNGYYDFIDNAQFDVTDQLCITLNNIMHVRKFLQELPRLLNYEAVCQNMSVKHEDEDIGHRALQVLENLIASADSDMNVRCRMVIRNIVYKMAVDMNRLTKKFTLKEPKKKASLDPLFAYLDTNLQVLYEKLESMIFPVILEEIWFSVLENFKENLQMGESSEYYNHMLNHLYSIRDYVLRGMSESESVQETDMYCSLIRDLQMYSMTTEELACLYYKEVATDNSSPQQYYGRVALKAAWQPTSEDTVTVHCKVCSAEDLPAMCTDNTSNPVVTVSLQPEACVSTASRHTQHTNTIDNSLHPKFEQHFVFESVPRDLVSRDDRLLLLTVSHHESLLPNDFLGEVAVPFCDLDSMQGVTSLEEIPARMLPLRRPKQPHDGVFCILKQRQKKDKVAKELVKARSVMAGWEEVPVIVSPFAKAISKVKGKRSEVKGQDYIMGQNLL